MEDTSNIVWEAQLKAAGASEVESELGKLMSSLKDVLELLDSTQDKSEKETIWSKNAEELSEYITLLRSYSHVMSEVMRTQAGNVIDPSVIAKRLVGLDHQYVKMEASKDLTPDTPYHPVVSTPLGEKRPSDFSQYRHANIGDLHRGIMTYANTESFGSQTINDSNNNALVAERASYKLSAKAAILENRGRNGDKEKSNELTVLASGTQWVAKQQADYAQILKDFEGMGRSVSSIVKITHELKASVAKINELSVREEKYEDLGDKPAATRIRKKRESLVYGMDDLMRRSNDIATKVGPEHLSPEYQQSRVEAGEMQSKAAKSIVERRERESQQSKADKIINKAQGKLNKMDTLHGDIKQAEDAGDEEGARHLRRQLNREAKSIPDLRRELRGAAKGMENAPADLSSLLVQLTMAKNGVHNPRDSEGFWDKVIRQQERIEKGIDKGERRTIAVSNGEARTHFDFKDVRAEIAAGVKAGLLDSTTASTYNKRIDHLEGLRGGASLKGEAEGQKKELVELIARMDRARTIANTLRGDGDTKGADDKDREALRYSRDIYSAIERSNELLDRINRAGGMEDTYHDLSKAADSARFTGAATNQRIRESLNNDDGPVGKGGLGGWVRGEMHRLPGGRIASAMFGDQVAATVNGGGGKILESLMGTVAGQAIGKTTLGKAVYQAGSKALGGAVEVAGGAEALSAVGMAAAPVAVPLIVAGVGAYAANKYANRMYDRGSMARQEEMQAGDIARASGSTSRLLDDVRQSDGHGGSGALRNAYQRLGYSSGDVLNYMGSANITGLSDDVRQRATMTGLRVARAHGLDTGEMAGIQSDLKKSTYGADSQGQLENDMSRFSLILSEAVKRGTSGPEMTQAFKGALASSTQLAGGKLFSAQNDLFMSQMLSLQRTNDPYLKGQNGVNTLTSMNNTLGNVQGADRMLFYSAMKDKSATELGYTGDQAKKVQFMLDQNPLTAMGYIQKNQTKQTTALERDQIFKVAGGDFSKAQGLFQDSGMGEVESSDAAYDYAQQYKKYGGNISQIHVGAWDAWSGRNGDAKQGDIDKSFGDVQKDNANEGIARRQENNVNEIKMRASHVSFDSVSGQMAIQSVQSITLSGISAEKAFQTQVQGAGNPVSEVWQNSHKKGFSTGGYTGDVGVSNVAGVVHGQEFVVNAQGTANNRELLEYLNRGGRVSGFKSGGYTGGGGAASTDHMLIDVLGDLNTTLKTIKGSSLRSDLSSTLNGSSSETNDAPTMLKGFFGRFIGGVKSFLGIGGSGGSNDVSTPTGVSDTGYSPSNGGSSFSGGSGKGSFIKGMGGKEAQTALAALNDNHFTSFLEQCSVFARQVTERTLGLKDHALSGKLYGGSAIDSGNLWKSHGLTKSYKDAIAAGGLKDGDNIFQMRGSGGSGHVGVVVTDPNTGKLSVAENTSRGRGARGGKGGQGAKMLTPIENFGQIDLVGRLGGWGGSNSSVGVNQTGSAVTTPGGNLGTLIKAIATQESHGDYKVVNSRTGALGKYQVMPQNLLGWGKNRGKAGVGWDYEALGRDITPQQYLNSPELQEKISQYQIGKMYNQQLKVTKGNSALAMERTARIWYSNDPNGSGGGVGNEPTTAAYGQQVVSRALASGSGAGGAVRHSGTIRVEVHTNGKLDHAATQTMNNAVAAKVAGKVIPPAPRSALAATSTPTRSRARPGG